MNSIIRFGLLFGSMILVLAFVGAGVQACTQQEAKTAIDDVLPIAQLICLETSGATTLTGLKAVCSGIDQLTPAQLNVVVGLLAQKQAAEKVGYYWQKADAGAGGTGSLSLSVDVRGDAGNNSGAAK